MNRIKTVQISVKIHQTLVPWRFQSVPSPNLHFLDLQYISHYYACQEVILYLP